jgi:hypothetical protein
MQLFHRGVVIATCDEKETIVYADIGKTVLNHCILLVL